MTVIASDSFNRADSSTTLGTTDSYNGGTAKTWTMYGPTSALPTYGISSNQAYMVSNNGGYANGSFAAVDAGVSDVKYTITINPAAACYLVLRASAYNQYVFLATGNPYTLRTYSNGTFTTIASASVGSAVGDVVSITLSGSTIAVSKNGTQIISATSTFNQTSTVFGFSGQSSTSTRFDNFTVEDLATSGTAYSADGTASGVASATGSTVESLVGSGNVIGVSLATGSTLFILGANGSTLGIASLTSNETMNIPSIFNASGTSSGLTSTTGQAIIIMLASGTAYGIADAEFFRFVFSPPPECMITSQILNYTQSFPVLIQDAVGSTVTIINVTPDVNGHFQIKLPMEEVRVMVLINGKLYLDRYIWALDGESRLPIINYR